VVNSVLHSTAATALNYFLYKMSPSAASSEYFKTAAMSQQCLSDMLNSLSLLNGFSLLRLGWYCLKIL